MDLHSEFTHIIRGLNRHRIHYALIGGLALGFYDRPRFTKDIDILTLHSQIGAIRNLLASLDYDESAKPWTFHSSALTLHRFTKIEGTDMVMFDVLAGEKQFHTSILSRARKVRSESGMVKIAEIDDLISLKKLRNSDQDKVDIKNLKKAQRAS